MSADEEEPEQDQKQIFPAQRLLLVLEQIIPVFLQEQEVLPQEGRQ